MLGMLCLVALLLVVLSIRSDILTREMNRAIGSSLFFIMLCREHSYKIGDIRV